MTHLRHAVAERRPTLRSAQTSAEDYRRAENKRPASGAGDPKTVTFPNVF